MRTKYASKEEKEAVNKRLDAIQAELRAKYTKRQRLEQTLAGLLRTHDGLRGGYKADSTRKINQFRARLAKLGEVE